MMKKSIQTMAVVPFLFFAFIVPSSSFADDLSLDFPCPGGGDIVADGSWELFSGTVNFSVTSTDCVLKGGETVNVNGSTTGIFQLRLETVKVDITTQFEASVTDEDGTILLSRSVDRIIKGDYDLAAGKLNGTLTNNRTWTAEDMPISIGELFAVDEILDD